MSAIAFDTLAYSKKMKELGFTDRQAEGQATELAHIIDNQIATKLDLELLKKDLIIKLGSMIIASFIATVSILGFLIRMEH